MMNRFFLLRFGASMLPPSLRPRVNEPNLDRKTRADIRREILCKLSTRMNNLGIFNR
jgi:hypothetical protein